MHQGKRQIRSDLSCLITCIVCLIAIVALIPCLPAKAVGTSRVTESTTIKRTLAEEINAYRLAHGLPPYAISPQLSAAAQAHVDDMITHHFLGYRGSDGSTVYERVARTGYGAWSWGRWIGENRYAGTNSANAMRFWLDHEACAENLLHPIYREMGIGHGVNQDGWHVLVVNFGVQPNVLPVFINDDRESTHSPTVRLTLTNEKAIPQGEGEQIIGSVTEIMVSNSPDFEGSKWQPYREHIEWHLKPGTGRKIVWVRLRDACGRTVVSSDEIWLDAGETTAKSAATWISTFTPGTTTSIATLTPSVTAVRTPSPTMSLAAAQTSTLSPSVTATRAPTATPSATATQTFTPIPSMTATHTPTSAPSITATCTPTSVPSATLRPTATAVTREPSPTPLGSPTRRASQTPSPAILETTTSSPGHSSSRSFTGTLVILLAVVLFLLLAVQRLLARR